MQNRDLWRKMRTRLNGEATLGTYPYNSLKEQKDTANIFKGQFKGEHENFEEFDYEKLANVLYHFYMDMRRSSLLLGNCFT